MTVLKHQLLDGL